MVGWRKSNTTLQAKIHKRGKLTRSPEYGGYCIKYKQRGDGVKFTVSNTSNIEARCIKYERFLKLLLYQIQATVVVVVVVDVGG